MSKEKRAKRKPNWLDPTTTAENEVMPRYFKWAYSSRGLSFSINVILIMQLTYFCTDMLGLSAAMVGSLLLAARLFDGATDLIAGYIIDNTHTKWGKARPYEIFIVFVWLFTVVLFSAPHMSTTATAAFVFILYILINAICSTFLNANDSVYLGRAVRSEKNRIAAASFNGAIIMVGSIFVSAMLPQLIGTIGTTREGWRTIALTLAIPMALIGLLRFIFVKEVVELGDKSAANEAVPVKAEKISVKDSVVCLFKNKYAIMICIMCVAIQLTTNSVSAVSTYYFKYIFGNIRSASLVSLSSVAAPIVMLLFPLLARKISPTKIMRYGALLAVLGYGIRFIGGTNVITILIGSFVSGIGAMPITMLPNLYLIDAMDYGEWKTGKRVEGIIGSVKSFSDKIGQGLAAVLVGLIMGLSGYNGALEVQSAAANTAIVGLFNLLPTICCAVIFIVALMYRLDENMPQIKEDLKKKHQA